MNFCPLKSKASDPGQLSREYKSARKCDVFRLGTEHLFVRKRLKILYIAYNEITRCFRRVLMVPIRVSCCGGEMEVENIVICDDTGELAMVLLRDPRMAKSVMDNLRELAPQAEFCKPPGNEIKEQVTANG